MHQSFQENYTTVQQQVRPCVLQIYKIKKKRNAEIDVTDVALL